MEKDTKKKNQKKGMIKKVLISIGIAGLSLLTIKAIMRGKQQQKKKECQNMSIARESTLKAPCSPTPPEKEVYKQDYNDEAIVRKCNKLLKKLWKSGNPDNKYYFDDEVFIDIKSCPYPPFIAQDMN